MDGRISRENMCTCEVQLLFIVLQSWFCCCCPFSFATLMADIWEMLRKCPFDSSWDPGAGFNLGRQYSEVASLTWAGVRSVKPHGEQRGSKKLWYHEIVSSVWKLSSLGGCHGIREVLQRISSLVWVRRGILWWRGLWEGGLKRITTRQLQWPLKPQRSSCCCLYLVFAKFKHGYQETTEFSFL